MCGVGICADWFIDGVLGKLLSVLRAFSPGEPTKKKFVGELMAWSSKYGEYPQGDPELHHVVGTLFAEGMKRKILKRLYAV